MSGANEGEGAVAERFDPPHPNPLPAGERECDASLRQRVGAGLGDLGVLRGQRAGEFQG